MFFEYGDDSVAQLGGVHLACEQASNLLTKVLEWGRLMAYLEQSTRYIAYDARLGGRYRYYRDPERARVAARHPLRRRHGPAVRHLRRARPGRCRTTSGSGFPKDPATPTSSTARRSGPRRSTPLRGILPAASLSNVGIYGTGQAYEQLLLRMRAHPLPEARAYADLMLTELRKVIPSFLKRVDLADRGVAWSDLPRPTPATAMEERRRPAVPGGPTPERRARRSRSSTSTPTPRSSWSPRCSTPTPTCPRTRSRPGCARCRADERVAVVRAYVGDRTNRRHKPGRALERTVYRFDVLADYGAFRDLQRHRMLTIEWQRLTPAPRLHPARGRRRRRRRATAFDEAMDRSAALYDALVERVPGPGRLRRGPGLPGPLRRCSSTPGRPCTCSSCAPRPQGHPAYRRVGQEMHRLIAEQAGHHAVAEMMRYVDHARARARAARRRAPGRGPAPRRLTRPASGIRLRTSARRRRARGPDRGRAYHDRRRSAPSGGGRHWLTTTIDDEDDIADDDDRRRGTRRGGPRRGRCSSRTLDDEDARRRADDDLVADDDDVVEVDEDDDEDEPPAPGQAARPTTRRTTTTRSSTPTTSRPTSTRS